MPFHNSTQHRPNFLNIVHKAFCDLVSCLSFQPHLPDQATASQSTDPIVQSSQTICSSLKIISYLCPFAHTGPCTVTVISLVRSRWGTIAITLYVFPKFHLRSLPWPLHTSSEFPLHLGPVAVMHLPHHHVGHIMAQGHSVIMHLLIFPDSSSRSPQYSNQYGHFTKCTLSKYLLHESKGFIELFTETGDIKGMWKAISH